METKISIIKEKVKPRPSRFYSPELKKEILEICEKLHPLGWTRKRIQNALSVGYKSIDTWKKPNIKIQEVQIERSPLRRDLRSSSLPFKRQHLVIRHPEPKDHGP